MHTTSNNRRVQNPNNGWQNVGRVLDIIDPKEIGNNTEHKVLYNILKYSVGYNQFYTVKKNGEAITQEQWAEKLGMSKQTFNTTIKSLEKKVTILKKTLSQIENSEPLKQKSQMFYDKANLVLSNLHKIKPYQKSIEVLNYQGDLEVINFPKEVKNIANIANIFFNNAKRLKQKSQNSHLEIENLNSKIKFLNSLIMIISKAQSVDELNIYFPKKQNHRIYH